ncbi:MAG: AMP-binding protein [Syntrophomonadales bacterium]|jgi:acyl-CoA synthetase (AMP-forming)/AMP-acid ligase II
MEFKPMERIWEKHYQTDYILGKDVFMGRDPVVQHLIYNAYKFRDKPAIIYYGTEFTWTEFKNMVLKVAGGLRRLGVKKGDRVYLGMQNCPQFIFSYWGAHAIGAIVVPGSPMFKQGELQYALNDSGAKVVIMEDGLYHIFESISDQVPSVSGVVVTSLGEYLPEVPTLPVPDGIVADNPPCTGAISWREFISADPIEQPEKLDLEDVAQLQYTSGTTGHPKGAILVHRNLLWKAIMYSHNAARVDDINLAALPLFHITGMVGHMISPVYSGSTIVVLARFDPLTALKAFERYKITSFIAITTMNIALINHPEAANYDLSTWRLYWMGGAPLPEAVQQKYFNLGIRLAEGYGMSETVSTVIQTIPRWIKPGSIGLPFSGVDIRIVDPTDNSKDMPMGEEGELWVHDNSVAVGYWNKPEDTAESFPAPGWIKTGDIARIDEDGFVWLCGRLKEMIKASGYSVFPAEVEEYLYKHPAISECAVIGVPHDYRGEDVKAFVVLKPDWEGKVTEEELVAWAREQMSVYKYPRTIEFRKELPKGGTGKILRKILKAEEAERRGEKN